MRYFVAYMLKGPEKDAVDLLRQEIAAAFSVQAALKIPPHLTLFYPFETDDTRPLEAAMSELARSQSSFPLRVAGFDSFDQHVWFIDVEKHQALLSLKERIDATIKSALGIENLHRGRGYNPHITLAYKDMSSEAFRLIGGHLKARPVPVVALTVGSISLLRFEAGRWEECATWKLRGPAR